MQISMALIFMGMYVAATPPAEQSLKRYEFLQIRMGVPFAISLYAPDEAAANKAARAAYARIKILDHIFSDYDPDSEAMQLSRSAAAGRPVKVSEELQFVLSRSLELSRRTEGAFDVTVGPLVKLWRQARRQKRLPDSETLAAARELVGHRHVRLDQENGTVELLKRGMRLDFGGIAKGYAADEALVVLQDHGIRRALIDAAGDVVVGDPPPGKKGWRIAIAPFDRPDADPNRLLLLKNAAVATSGDAVRHVEIDGIRYSHLIDPSTGLGLTHRSSITVLAADGLTADGLASAVSVLGRERGLKLIEETEGTAALVVTLEEGEPQEFSSKRFASFLLKD